MAVTTSNLALGPGTLYYGDFGATEPADADINSTPATSAWTDVGGTLGGIAKEITQEFTELDVDQITWVPESRVTKNSVTLKTRLAETTLDNLQLALNGGTQSTPETGVDAFVPDMSGSDNSPDYAALIFDGYGPGGYRRRIIIRKVLSVESVPVTSSKTDQQAFDVTFRAHYVSSSIEPYRILQATA